MDVRTEPELNVGAVSTLLCWVTWQDLDLTPEDEVPAVVEESQGERLRRSLVLLDVHLPAVALPDGVHCRAFTGARTAACSGTPAPQDSSRHDSHEAPLHDSTNMSRATASWGLGVATMLVCCLRVACKSVC